MGSRHLFGGTRLGPAQRSGNGKRAGDDQSGDSQEPSQGSDSPGDDGRAKLKAIRELIRNHPALYSQLPRLSWRKLAIIYGDDEILARAGGTSSTGVVSSYRTLFHGVWLKRGYSAACVDRMWELNQAGVTDPEMLEKVKQEGLVG